MPAAPLAERIAGLRDRLLASPRFRRLAAAFPLTRPIARRHARELFDLVAGFVYSQVLQACVRLDLFEFLAAGARPLAEVARHAGLEPPAARRLLDAAAALRLVSRRRGDRYGLGPLGAALRHNPGISAMVEHHALLYEALAEPVGLLRNGPGGTELARYWAYAGAGRPAPGEAGAVAGYTALMSASQSLVAEEVLDAYDFRRHRCLLDVGGGDGTFLAAVAARVPGLALQLFDLPPVAAAARGRLAAAGLAGRVTVHGGSFLDEPLPRGADLVSLVRVVHDHDDEPARRLLAAVRACLPAHGTLLIAEPMAGVGGTEAVADAYFGLYLWAMGQGRARSPRELRGLLREAGFSRSRCVATRMPLQTGLIVARP